MGNALSPRITVSSEHIPVNCVTERGTEVPAFTYIVGFGNTLPVSATYADTSLTSLILLVDKATAH